MIENKCMHIAIVNAFKINRINISLFLAAIKPKMAIHVSMPGRDENEDLPAIKYLIMEKIPNKNRTMPYLLILYSFKSNTLNVKITNVSAINRPNISNYYNFFSYQVL